MMARGVMMAVAGRRSGRRDGERPVRALHRAAAGEHRRRLRDAHARAGLRQWHRLRRALDGLHRRVGLGALLEHVLWRCALTAHTPRDPTTSGAHPRLTQHSPRRPGPLLTLACALCGCAAGAHTFSYGIWKSVYLARIGAAHAAITHVVPQVFYEGAYPVAPLSDGSHGGFRVDVKVR
jgi:hypothetical protein